MLEQTIEWLTEWVGTLKNDNTDMYFILLGMALLTATHKVLKRVFFIIIALILISLFIYVRFIR